MTEESPGTTETRKCEKRPQGTKQLFNDEGDDQAMPEPEEGPTQSNNVPTPPYTTPHSGGRNMRSSQVCSVCHHSTNSSGSANTGRRPRMAGVDMKLPFFQGNGTEDPEQYWFLYEVVWIIRHTINDDVKKGQLVTTLRGCALDCFMKFIQFPTGTLATTLDKIVQRLLPTHWKKSYRD